MKFIFICVCHSAFKIVQNLKVKIRISIRNFIALYFTDISFGKNLC